MYARGSGEYADICAVCVIGGFWRNIENFSPSIATSRRKALGDNVMTVMSRARRGGLGIEIGGLLIPM